MNKGRTPLKNKKLLNGHSLFSDGQYGKWKSKTRFNRVAQIQVLMVMILMIVMMKIMIIMMVILMKIIPKLTNTMIDCRLQMFSFQGLSFGKKNQLSGQR